MPKPLKPLCPLLALALATTALAAADVRTYRGDASDLKTGRFLYSENHEERYEGGEHVRSIVRCRDADEREICRKIITTFRNSRTAPDIRWVRFKLAATGLLARLFVDPVTIAYDLDRKRLMEYRGTTNINDARGKSHYARIVFTCLWMQRRRSGKAAPGG